MNHERHEATSEAHSLYADAHQSVYVYAELTNNGLYQTWPKIDTCWLYYPINNTFNKNGSPNIKLTMFVNPTKRKSRVYSY